MNRLLKGWARRSRGSCVLNRRYLAIVRRRGARYR
jgi:hypothetical protein